MPTSPACRAPTARSTSAAPPTSSWSSRSSSIRNISSRSTSPAGSSARRSGAGQLSTHHHRTPVPLQRWHFTTLSPFLSRPLPSQFLHFCFFLMFGPFSLVMDGSCRGGGTGALYRILNPRKRQKSSRVLCRNPRVRSGTPANIRAGGAADRLDRLTGRAVQRWVRPGESDCSGSCVVADRRHVDALHRDRSHDGNGEGDSTQNQGHPILGFHRQTSAKRLRSAGIMPDLRFSCSHLVQAAPDTTPRPSFSARLRHA